MEILKEIKQIQLRTAKNEHVQEEDIRQALNNDIKSYMKFKYNEDIEFRNEVRTSNGTFIDTKYFNFVIEYKANDVKINDVYRKQLIDYLKTMTDKKYSWGVITNSNQIEFYSFSEQIDGYKKMFENDQQLTDKLTEDKLLKICELLSKRDKIILNEENINDYLGVENNKLIIKKIHNYIINSRNARTLLLYDEWQKLFNLSDDHDKYDQEKKRKVGQFYQELLDVRINTAEQEHKALFAIQTYYSIMTKLVLFRLYFEGNAQIDHKYKDVFLCLESNEYYRSKGISNMIDGDFFSWYLEEFEEDDFKYFYDKTMSIESINTAKTNMLFIKFYENIFPFWVRHAMGEYYTPDYLAQDVLSNAFTILTKKDNYSVLDPTCGSGIFLLKAMEMGVKQVYGVDINPLAVLTAKVNYLMNYSKTAGENMLEIPIYLGDSTYFPKEIEISGIECLQHNLITSTRIGQTINFVFSKDIVNHENFFEILDKIEEYIRAGSRHQCIQYIESYREFHYNELKNEYNELIDTLFSLENKNLNSIWLKIIGNYLKTGTLRNMDYIVGNPPWVRWSNLPDEYRNLIRSQCRIDGIFSGDKNVGGVDLNICALIAYVTIRERLNKDGVLGFIMPDSILFNKSFEGFRKMKILDDTRFYLNKVVRWNNKNEKPFDPVTLNFALYFFTYHKPNKIPVQERKDGTFKVAYNYENSFNNHYMIITEQEYNEIHKVLGTNNYKFRSGVGLLKGGHYLLEFKRKHDNNCSEFYVYETDGNRLRISNKTIILEHELVYPYIKSDCIDDNRITETKYFCIFPFPYGSKEPYSLSELRKKFPKFCRYFMSQEIQDAIRNSSSYNQRVQKTSFDVGIFRVGDYTYSDWYLATRDNTKSVFSIVTKIKCPWGEKKIPIFDGHINYLSRDEDNKKLSRKKVAELFNAFTRKGVKLYVMNSSDSRSISSRLYNDIKVD